MPSSRPVVLLMTATITPPPGVSARPNPADRLADYRRALEFNLSLVGREADRLVFVDNSDSDVSSLRQAAEATGLADRCEFLVFQGLDYPPVYGYGYGEFKLLDFAMRNARSILEQSGEPAVIKITGRYRVRNLARFLRGLPDRFDVLCDIRNVRRPWADLRVMGWTPAGYEAHLKGVYASLRDDLNRHPPEMFVSRHLLAAAPRASIVTRFPFELHVDGIRGYDGRNWSGGLFMLKHYTRAFLRRLLFWYPI